MKKTATRGFTLIELAVVIALLAILAAVAVSRLGQIPATTEEAVAMDFLSQLKSAAAMYTAHTGDRPSDFSDFVSTTAPPTGNMTSTVAGFGTHSASNPCTVSGSTITCSGTFTHYPSVTYQWADGEITVTGL